MAPRGYATNAQVAAYLGQTFTAAQDIEADLLIEAAENYADSRTGRTWLSAAVTDEAYYAPAGSVLYLRKAPLSSATVTVKARSSPSDTETTLVAVTDYELEDLASGRLRVPAALNYDRLRVSYTPVATIDQGIALAVKLLVAAWMRPLLEGVSAGIKSYSVGGELSVTYADGTTQNGVPPEVEALLGANRRLVFA